MEVRDVVPASVWITLVFAAIVAGGPSRAFAATNRPPMASSDTAMRSITTDTNSADSTSSGANTSGALPQDRSTARFLVVIGNNSGDTQGHERQPLAFADDDAARLFLQLAPSAERAYLLATFDNESARTWPELTDIARPPTRQALAGVLGEVNWLVRAQHKRGRATELVFAFAGHGDVTDGGEGYIVLADGPFTRTDLETQVLEPSPADINHVFIDACSSYFMVQARGREESGRAVLTPALLDVLQGSTRSQSLRTRTGVFVSTSSASNVHESSELQSGVFSFLLRSALAGAGDSNGDGRVEYPEAAAFMASASSGLSDPRARLQVHAQAPTQRPHVPLIDLAIAGAQHFLAVPSNAHVRILDARGVPYAEVNNASPVMLALLGNPYFIVQRDERGRVTEAVLVPRAAGAYALSSLSFEDTPRARGNSFATFDGLFRARFEPSFFAGFLATSDLAPPMNGPRFVVDWAPAGTPPVKIPVGAIGAASLAAAGLLGAGAGAAAVANQLAFDSLKSTLNATGQIDPHKSLEVEGWRNLAANLTLGSVALGLSGSALVLWSLNLDDGEAEVR